MLAASLGTIAFNPPAQIPTPTPTSTAPAPIVEELGAQLVDEWRMETVWDCGGTVNRCMHGESEALVLARVAMGEAPNSLSDRVYIMWSIKLNAALGFKEALPGWRRPVDSWGPPTGIYVEALCNGGCQYSPVRAAEQIFFPCELSEYHPLRGMLCPTDEQLLDFYWTWDFATGIVMQGFEHFPEELKGYEHFRSPTIDGEGRFHRDAGARSRIFFRGGNVWRDEYREDDLFWRRWDAAKVIVTPDGTLAPGCEAASADGETWEVFCPRTATPTATASPVATRTPTSTPTVTLTPAPVFATLEPDPPAAVDRSTKEVQMKLATRTHPLVVVALGIFLILSLSAFLLQADLPEGVEAAIAGVISFVVMILGPKPLKSIYDAIGLPGGAVRVIATYVVSLVIGAGALFIAGAVSGVPADLDSILALGGLLLAASGVAFQRLKDRGAFSA